MFRLLCSLLLASFLLVLSVWVVPPRLFASDAEIEVLVTAVSEICTEEDHPYIYTIGKMYTMVCEPGARSTNGVEIQRFTTASLAQASFEQARGARPRRSFSEYRYPSYEEKFKDSSNPHIHYRRHVWQAGRWVFVSRAVDSSEEEIAKSPEQVSEVIYRAVLESRLFSAQYSVYLPLVSKNSSVAAQKAVAKRMVLLQQPSLQTKRTAGVYR